MLYELMMARARELEAQELAITQRMTWEQILKVERLERALKKARATLQLLPNLAKVH